LKKDLQALTLQPLHVKLVPRLEVSGAEMVYTVILQRKTKLTEIEKYNTSKETMFTIYDIKIN